MEWLNEPASWQRTGDVLTVSVDPGTDFWRETGYGYIRDSGHVYGEVLAGDLDVTVRLRGVLGSQFDQAGVMLRADEQTWIKTGVEFFEGRPRLSTVLTLGRSSWMVTDLPEGCDDISLRVSRRGDAAEVRYQLADGPDELAALVFMPPGRPVLAGVMCAAPEGPGFRVSFHDLHVSEPDWAGQAEDGAAEWSGDEEPVWAAGDGAAPEWASRNAAAAWAGEGPAPEWAGEGPAPEWAAETDAAGWAAEPVSTEDPGDEPTEDESGWLEDPGDSVTDHAEWVKELARDDDDPEWAVTGAHPDPAPVDEPADPPAGQAKDEAGDEPTGPDSPEPARSGEPANGKSTAGDQTWAPAPTLAPGDRAGPADADMAANWERLAAGAQPAGARGAGARAGWWAAQQDADVTSEWPGPPPRAAQVAAVTGDLAAPEPSAADGAADGTSPDSEPVTDNGRKATVLRPPLDLPGPPDPADEWISLLTADPAEE